MTGELDSGKKAGSTPAADSYALTPQEERLLDCAAKGQWWEPLEEDGKIPDSDPTKADSWDSRRTIRAEVIRCLATGENWQGQTSWKVSTKGLRSTGARIVGSLDLEGATISCMLWFHNCQFEERIQLWDANTRTVSLRGSVLKNGLNAIRAKINGSLYLNHGFHAHSLADISGATIAGELDCTGGTFEKADGIALRGRSITVDAGVLLCNGFRAKGGVDLMRATIKGHLDCSKSSFENSNWPALNGDALIVGSDLFLRNDFLAKGGANLRGANIGGQIDCSKGIFESATGLALNCDAITVGTDVFLREGFHATGKVNFARAKITGALQCINATFENPKGDALSLSLAEIDAGILLRGLKSAKEGQRVFTGKVVLAQATCRVYADDPTSWPENGELVLDGFSYERFYNCPTDWKTRKNWLKLQISEHLNNSFRPQPWTQAVKVLRDMGHDSDARELALCREIARRKSRRRGFFRRIWSWVLQYTIGFGYKPHRVLYWLLGLVMFGWIVFATAANLGFVVPRNPGVLTENSGLGPPQTYPCFNAAIFALDDFLPIIDLGQKTSWTLSNAQFGHEPFHSDGWSVKTARLVLGQNWTVTGKPTSDNATNNAPPAWNISPDVKETDSFTEILLHDAASVGVVAFRWGFHRLVYWFNELAGWLLISLFIAGMSGIMKRE